MPLLSEIHDNDTSETKLGEAKVLFKIYWKIFPWFNILLTLAFFTEKSAIFKKITSLTLNLMEIGRDVS